MKVLVVEDDLIALDIVVEFLEDYGLRSISHSNTVEKAITYLRDTVYDLIFLDIHLDDGKGTELIEYIPSATEVVFTTSDPSYALKAFEVNALDYLLKPITKSRFANTMNKIEVDKKDQTLLIKADYQYYKVLVSSILYVKANKDYLTLYTEDGNYTFYARMKNFINKLPKSDFMICHRSYIINLNKVKTYTPTSAVINNIEISVSGSNKKEFLERISTRIQS